MRDKTASRTFRAKKKLDHFLEAALPGVYLPLYTMVTFTRIPYAQAARRARLQDRILYAALVLIGILALAVLLARSQRQWNRCNPSSVTRPLSYACASVDVAWR